MGKKEKVLEGLRAGKEPAEIAKEAGCSKQYVYLMKEQLAKTTPTPPTEPKPPSKAEVTFQFEQAKPSPEITTPKPTQKEAEKTAAEFKAVAEAGLFTGEELAALFKAINNTVAKEMGKEYAPDEASALLLGKCWTKPVNRWLSKDIGNWDVIIAAICTLVIYVPTIFKIVKRALEKKKEEKAKAEEKKHNVEATP